MTHQPGIVVATVTLVRSEAEDILMRQALTELARSGLRVAVADGGSPPAFVDAVASLPGFAVRSGVGGGLLAQLRASLEVALRWAPARVLYTEPDKYDFFARHLPSFLARATPEDATVVRASRTPAAFATYPATQQCVETAVNELCAETTGLAADYSYGPFVVDPQCAGYLDGLPADTGWGWRPYLFTKAAGDGNRIASIAGDYDCPESQRVNDRHERTHRLRQLAQNAMGIARALDERRG